jgi:hypothetical protein
MSGQPDERGDERRNVIELELSGHRYDRQVADPDTAIRELS